MKKILIISLLCVCANTYSQNIVGTWKRVSSVLEYTNGKTDDLQKLMESTFPCITEIKYVFEQSGKHFMVIPKDCKSIPNTEANWKVLGNQLIMNQKSGKEILNINYDLDFSGNTMTMTPIIPKQQSLLKRKE
ncbi:lipocalin family protein [Arcicella aurantiaca]|nr:lipocalin family protein [Arcicella aurantiaca]